MTGDKHGYFTVRQLKDVLDQYDDDKPVNVIIDPAGKLADMNQEQFRNWKNANRKQDEPYLLVPVCRQVEILFKSVENPPEIEKAT